MTLSSMRLGNAQAMWALVSVLALAACAPSREERESESYRQSILSIPDDEIARLNGYTLAPIDREERDDRDPRRPPEYPARLYRTRYTPVTDQLGELLINERWQEERDERTGKMFQTAKWEATAAQEPWSSWWYPINETTLFRMPQASDGPAPLQRWDLLTGRSAAKYEENDGDHGYDKSAASWEGRCLAWAIASILEPAPKAPITVRGRTGQTVTLDVADQKALLIKLYEKPEVLEDWRRGDSPNQRGDTPPGELILYGNRYIAGQPKGSHLEDIYPEQFHRFLDHELRENRRAFVMDWDPGEAVWSVPVYKAQVTMHRTQSRLQLEDRHVDVNVIRTYTTLYTGNYGAADRNRSRASLNSNNYPVKVYTYNYDLVVLEDRRGAQRIAFGIWLDEENGGVEDSLRNHPDHLIAMPKRWVPKSLNPELDYEEYKRLTRM